MAFADGEHLREASGTIAKPSLIAQPSPKAMERNFIANV